MFRLPCFNFTLNTPLLHLNSTYFPYYYAVLDKQKRKAFGNIFQCQLRLGGAKVTHMQTSIHYKRNEVIDS